MELNLHAPINRLGYGVVGYNIAKALHNLNVKINLIPIGQPQINIKEDHQLIQEWVNNGQFFSYDACTLKIWHQHSLADHVGRGKYITMPIFELNKFTKQEKHHLSFPDRLYVNSDWAKRVIDKELGHSTFQFKTKTIPLGIDPNIFYPDNKSTNLDKYIFLNVGKFEIRKGHDILVSIFNEAFTQSDNVELWMMCHNPFFSKEENEEWSSMYKNSRLGNKIKILKPVQTHQEVAKIIRLADCGVFPSRAEGFNLELLEMLAMGKPVIATNYSGHTEFCTKKNSYLIEVDKLEDAYDGRWFLNQGKWAEMGENQIEQCVEHMRYCYEKRPSNEEGVKTGKKFSWENSAKMILEDLF